MSALYPSLLEAIQDDETPSIITLFGDIDEAIAHKTIGRLLQLSAKDSAREIHFYISSYGGQIPAGFAIIDACKSIPNPIACLALGMAASMGALILNCAATPGRRFIMPHAQLMVHAPLGSVAGTVTSIDSKSRQFLKVRDQINKLLVEATGLSKKRVAALCREDNWFTAEEAVRAGLADSILKSAKKEAPPKTFSLIASEIVIEDEEEESVAAKEARAL